MIRPTVVILALCLLAIPSGAAEAMCGGNVFMTCPPAAKGASARTGPKATGSATAAARRPAKRAASRRGDPRLPPR